MGQVLKKRLKQGSFESSLQEAVLAVLVASSYLDDNFSKASGRFGISRQQYNILRILKGAGPAGHPCGEISSRMVDRAPDVTRRIDALEKLGLVERIRSSKDRRVVNITIRKEGLELLEKIEPGWQEFYKSLKQKVTAADCKALTALCEKIMTPTD